MFVLLLKEINKFVQIKEKDAAKEWKEAMNAVKDKFAFGKLEAEWEHQESVSIKLILLPFFVPLRANPVVPPSKATPNAVPVSLA